MIASLLPDSVATSECRDDPAEAFLLPGEEVAVARAVTRRRREYTTVRHCARQAMAALDLPAAPILPGPRRGPVWPEGVVGSMTHCAGYRAAAVARATDVVSLGIDAEEHAPLPETVDTLVSLPEERDRLRALAVSHPRVEWHRVLFSAKESVYKTWFPLTGRWLGFEDARLRFDPHAGTFTAELLVPGPVVDGVPVPAFAGRWLVRDGLVLTAIVLRRD